MSYSITSTKGKTEVDGNLADAISAALRMEADLQPAYGVTIELGGDTVATVSGGAHDIVVVEHMPVYLRASHEAAGNCGVYPHNGATRRLMDRANAECYEDEWTSIVRDASDNDLLRYEYATDL